MTDSPGCWSPWRSSNLPGDKAKDKPQEERGEPPRDSDASVAFQAALIAVREAHAGEVAALTARAAVAESFAAELRGRLDDMQGKLADVQSELAAAMDGADRANQQTACAAEAEADLRRELEAALIAVGEAQADVAELRQPEEARKGRGLVARLRGALRGE
jgi:hypothetical protein